MAGADIRSAPLRPEPPSSKRGQLPPGSAMHRMPHRAATCLPTNRVHLAGGSGSCQHHAEFEGGVDVSLALGLGLGQLLRDAEFLLFRHETAIEIPADDIDQAVAAVVLNDGV